MLNWFMSSKIQVLDIGLNANPLTEHIVSSRCGEEFDYSCDDRKKVNPHLACYEDRFNVRLFRQLRGGGKYER